MSDAANDYFAESASDEERILNLRALNQGFQAAMGDLLERFSSYLDLIGLELEDSPAGEIYLREADSSLQRATRLLEVYQNIAGAEDVGFESYDLKALIRGVAARLKRIDRPGFEIDFAAVAETDCFARGKLVLMHQALFDLAAMIAPAGRGKAAHVRLDSRHFPAEFFSSRKARLEAADYYLLTVTSDARELPTEALIALDEKLCSSPDLALPGQLLYILGVARLHGGELFCGPDGDLDSLALFLPVRKSQADMFGESSLDETPLKGQETVLLVDDEGVIWDVVIDMLQGLGYTVILAADGRECVEIYRNNPGEIDLVLLDMVMPEMDGHEAFFELKKIDPSVRVLLQSGYVAEEDAREVLDGGAAGFLRKPYRVAELASKIRGIVDHPKS